MLNPIEQAKSKKSKTGVSENDDQRKSGVSFFIELLIGSISGLIILSFLDIAPREMEDIRKITNISCFLTVTIGALLRDGKNKAIKKVGHFMIAMAAILIGFGVSLIIKNYASS